MKKNIEELKEAAAVMEIFIGAVNELAKLYDHSGDLEEGRMLYKEYIDMTFDSARENLIEKSQKKTL